MKKIEATIKGRVQGVFFRDFTRKQAKRFGLSGWVKNMKDGTVKVVAEGNKQDIDKFIDKLKKGSLPSRVDDVIVNYEEPKGEFSGFNIRY